MRVITDKQVNDFTIVAGSMRGSEKRFMYSIPDDKYSSFRTAAERDGVNIINEV